MGSVEDQDTDPLRLERGARSQPGRAGSNDDRGVVSHAANITTGSREIPWVIRGPGVLRSVATRDMTAIRVSIGLAIVVALAAALGLVLLRDSSPTDVGSDSTLPTTGTSVLIRRPQWIPLPRLGHPPQSF